MSGPDVAVGGIAFDDEYRVLLVKRAKEPGAGLWTIPGGHVRRGETLTDACVRELHEETGLDVEVGPIVTMVERLAHTDDGELRYHYLIVDYLVDIKGGELSAASDAADVKWCDTSALGELPLTDGLLPVLHQAVTMAAERAGTLAS